MTEVVTQVGPATGEAAAAAALAAIGARARENSLARVAVLEDAVAALIEGRLAAETRREAEREAHRVAGSAGTFGYPAASESARRLEVILSGVSPVPVPDVLAAAEIVVSLRAELEGEPTPQPPEGNPSASPQPLGEHDERTPGTLLLALGGGRRRDRRRRDEFVAAAAARGSRVHVMDDAEIPRGTGLAAAVVDLGVPGGARLVEHLSSAAPAVPTLALVADTFADRMVAARAGARAALPITVSTQELLNTVDGMLVRTRLSGTTVLAVGGNALLADVRNSLTPTGARVAALSDPASLWSAPTHEAADLLIVDHDSIESADELCRAVRLDPRCVLPIIVLTSAHDGATVRALIAAGADDVLTNPFTGPELVDRVRARLERSRALAAAVATDPVTGRVTSHEDSGTVPDLHRGARQTLGRDAPEVTHRVASDADRPSCGGPEQVPSAETPAPAYDADVVLVEDDETLVQLLGHTLGVRGYRWRHLADGQQAADQLAGSPTPLRARVLLLDVDLPGLDGLGVLRQMAASGALADTRVIMLTARSREAEVVAAFELGAFDHVGKPFSVPVLMQRIQRALDE